MASYEPEDWIFLGDDDKDVLNFKSLLELDIESSGAVPAQVLEQGSFAAYNKTEEPLRITASIGIEGTPADLQDALSAINLLKQETTVFSVITPEFEYANMTVESFSYARKREEGRGALYVQMALVEVREVETATTTVKLPPKKCKKKDCASQKNNGQQQPVGASMSKDVIPHKDGDKSLRKLGNGEYMQTEYRGGKWYDTGTILPNPSEGA